MPAFRLLSLPSIGLTIQHCACLLALSTVFSAHAAERPLWEVGAGAAAFTLPDYRGSDQRTTYLLPIPYIVYRGEYIKADRSGVRGMLFDSDRVELDFSLNGTLPVNSKDNVARRGMADLKPTVELGANLSVNLWRSASRDLKLDFRAPLRTAITIEASPHQIGWVFSPNLNLDVKNPAGMTGWHLGMLAGPLFNSQKYNAHFYSVSAADVLPDRPAYNAPGGYAGSQFTLAVSKRFPHHWVGAFVRYDTLAGAAFADSPLVKKRNAVSAGVAVSWVFGESSTLVKAND